MYYVHLQDKLTMKKNAHMYFLSYFETTFGGENNVM